MAGYNDAESGYVDGASGFFTLLGHIVDITNKFDKDAGPIDGDAWLYDSSTGVYIPRRGLELVHVKNHGAAVDGITDDSAAVVAARNKVLNSRPGGGSAPRLPMLYFPPGDCRVVSPDALLPTGGNLISGYTIAGSGHETSRVLFQPSGGSSTLTDMNLLTAVGSSAPRLMGLRIKDICFNSNNANASFAYLYSTATAYIQGTELDHVKFSGTWKRIIGLDGDSGANLNSEMTFNRIICNEDVSYTDAFLHSGITSPSTNTQQDQFLNYWFYGCQFSQATGDTLVYDKGGHIIVIGGSWIIGNSGTGTHFKMGDYSHLDATQFLKVIGLRVELRNQNQRVIDCAWRDGHISFDNFDDEAQGFNYAVNSNGSGGTANWDTHVYRTPQNSGPIVCYNDSALMGYHRVQTTATVPTTLKMIYKRCGFRNMQGGGVSLLSTATSQFLRYDSAVPHYRFEDNRFTTDVNA